MTGDDSGRPTSDPAVAPGADSAAGTGVDTDDAATAGHGPYAAVHARPEGEATVARMALTAAESGYAGVVVRNHGDADAEPVSEPPEDPAEGAYVPGRVAEAYDIDVVPAVEIRTEDRSQAAGLLSRYRDERVLVCVHGGSLNRWAVEDPRVDVLAHPTRGDGDLNHVLVKAAARNGVRLEFDLSRVLRRTGGERVQAVRGLRKQREIVAHYDAPFVVSADPTSHLQVRSPRALRAVAEVVGFQPEQVAAGLREWGRLAARNRERLGEDFIAPGVHRGRYEEVD
ncbi:RNase P subunit p30 family protein [Haloglomus litoreum]|uniref:RNase P subunit p30 family protein n=1 Tax=Haloglomus litoreum TaxID=3034026 RepID=UPI0023E7FF6F|nr:RNase P subunit p30 family protein [Haloglomus sp. DT116]